MVYTITKTSKLYLQCIKDSLLLLLKNWQLIILALVAYIIFIIVATIARPLGFAGGFLLGITEIVLLSYYYKWLAEVISFKKIYLKEAFEFNYPMFDGVLSVAFILFLLKFCIQIVLQNSPYSDFILLFNFAIVIIFNSIPETVYINGYRGMEALGYSLNFIKSYWIEWYIPYVILMAPIFFSVGLNESLTIFAYSEELLPIYTIVTIWKNYFLNYSYLLSFAGLILGTWFMIFRGLLFKKLVLKSIF